jgi:hypothetical protein
MSHSAMIPARAVLILCGHEFGFLVVLRISLVVGQREIHFLDIF